MFFLDMHCHSVASDDSRATVEQYLKWINVLRKRGNQVDGIVLTEHRQFDHEIDYSPLAEAYQVTILKGAELDTRYGHFLVYGVTPQLTKEINFADVTMDARELLRLSRDLGGFALPAHPGRYGIGLVEFVARGEEFPDVTVVETHNGSARPGENERGQEFASERRLLGTGGSDAHFVSAIGLCLTAFPRPVRSERDLVEALHEGKFHAVRLEKTQQALQEGREP